MTYADWCLAHNVDHGHCPNPHHDKPQPVMADGKLLCGCCLIVHGVESEMVPCTPKVCE